MTEINLRDIRKEYGDGVVGVQDLNLTIQDGEFLILVGPSGCGKTTTLELIAGLQRPTDGEITLDGEVVNDTSPQERGIAMVFQNYALYPHKRVRENIEFGLKYTSDLSSEDRNQKAIETAEMLEIEDLMDDKPKELSGGQQQRVALGRAIVRDPDVFLMDEPLSNLDAKLRTTMRAELQQLQRNLGITTIYVTHDQTEAMTMGDRIVVLNEGQLQQVGTPTELYNRPANTFVAGFIGSPSMNFVEGDLTEGTFNSPTFNYSFAENLGIQGESTLGIRPEDITIVDSESERAVAEATVTVVEEMGNVNLLYLDFGDTDFVANVDESINPEIGETVSIAFPEQYTYLFDDTDQLLKSREPHKPDDEVQTSNLEA